MSWVAVAVVGGAAIGAIGSNMAAGTQADAQKQAAQTQWQMFNTINQQEQPFIQGGYGALNALNYGLGIGGQQSIPLNGLMSGSPIPGYDPSSGYAIGGAGGISQLIPGGSGAPLNSMMTGGTQSSIPPGLEYGSLTRQFTPQDFLNNVDPGYQFQLQTGAQALRNADTPGVGALSGPALKDLMSFNQGMASTAFQSAFNRFTTQQNNIFSRLSGIAGMGQNAASQVGTAGTSLGTGMAQAQAAAGGSLAGGIVGATNSIGGSAVPLAYLLNQGGGGYNPQTYNGGIGTTASPDYYSQWRGGG